MVVICWSVLCQFYSKMTNVHSCLNLCTHYITYIASKVSLPEWPRRLPCQKHGHANCIYMALANPTRLYNEWKGDRRQAAGITSHVYTVLDRNMCRPGGVIFGQALILFGVDTPRDRPPPKPPFQRPHPNKKGTNLLFFQIGIHLHTHQDLELKHCRVMGQKLRHGCPCTRDLPGTHNWLAQPHIASILSEFH